MGIGAALRNGYERATMENVCAIPGDMQFDVKELLPFSQVKEKQIISFYRKENLQYSVFRNYLSLANKKLNAWLIGLKMRDVNWVKIYKLADLRKIDLRIKSSLVESEICAKMFHNGVTLKEVISKYNQRNYGKSKGASWKIAWQAIFDLWALVREVKRYKKR